MMDLENSVTAILATLPPPSLLLLMQMAAYSGARSVEEYACMKYFESVALRRKKASFTKRRRKRRTRLSTRSLMMDCFFGRS